MLKKMAVGGFFLFSLGFFFVTKAANAQTTPSPQLLVTWKASNSYIPSFYQGKALPSYGSKITASLEVISGGRIINVSSQPIYWYLDEVLVGGGAGVQQVTFSPFGAPPSSLYLTVELPEYNNGNTERDLQIPFVNPVTVIDAPYPNQEFSSNPLVVNAVPFFFNVASASDLSFSWSVNGQAGTSEENPQTADISLPAGTAGGTGINVSLSTENPTGAITATANKTLTYQNQL
jgi:hypothetical protein